ncbi:GTP cyclohydrolase II [Flagelloscypha sp. PMI_526]|nr:GTP cyclohydrolase II [Flagelloscypha sp. PMI_526]
MSPVPLTDAHPVPALLKPSKMLATRFAFDSVEDALASFAAGEFLVVVDDEHRENEGDLIIAAGQMTVKKMAWMINGYICAPLPGERLDELNIPMMFPNNQEKHKTAYTVTVDYKHGTTTGISASDRYLAAKGLADPNSQPSDFTRPGHMVPLRARPGGLLTRRGHTEAAIDLCLLTGQTPAGVLCELVNDDEEGTMARRDDCRAFANKWGLKMVSIDQLVEYRRTHPDAIGKGVLEGY